MSIRVSELVAHPLIWRFTGFCSSIVGFTSYAVSPSFRDLFGKWNHLKIVTYVVISSILSISVLLVKKCSQFGVLRSFLVKAHVAFMVLTLTSLYSVLLEDKSDEQGANKNNKGSYGNAMNITSTGAFALMALSLSRQLQLGFEVGVTNFLLGCFLVTVMKMNLKLAPVAAFFCYLLVNIRLFSNYVTEMRRGGNSTTSPRHAAEGDIHGGGNNIDDSYSELTHGAGGESSSNNQNTDDGREMLLSSQLEVRVDNVAEMGEDNSMDMWAYNCPVCKY